MNFYSRPLFTLTFIVPKEAAPLVEEAFASENTTVSSFEIEGTNKWKMDIYLSEKPDEKQVAESCRMLGVKDIEFSIAKLEEKDWVMETVRSFPPLTIGNYFVYGSHFEGEAPTAKIPMLIDAGIAFGSGEHQTTSACLLAMQGYAKKRKFRNVLDMGCGSGILSIGAKKTWKNAQVTGVDIDVDSVKFSRIYAKKNGLKKGIRFYAGNGYKIHEVGKAGKYDVIVSNILARPLMKIAKDLRKNLKKGGVCILSGITPRQQRMVLAAHLPHGLKQRKRILRDGWAALVLESISKGN